MKTHYELDFIGGVYAYTINQNNLGSFSISVHLQDSVDQQVLQQAVNDLIKRLPYINGRLTSDLQYEILTTPPKIKLDKVPVTFTDYYNHGQGHMLRILYGPLHIRVEVTHIMTDGRGVVSITRALIVRYFELLGIEMDKTGIIDCTKQMTLEESENAYERFANSEPIKRKPKKPKIKAYKHEHLKTTTARVITKNFELEKIKENAKIHEVTISEYILTHIFLAIAKERDKSGDVHKPITANIPVDLRSFFQTSTIRNFIGSSPNIIIREAGEFAEVSSQIRSQFEAITKSYLQAEINEFEISRKQLKSMPKLIRKLLLKFVMSQMYKETTTMFSNLGLVKFPKEIESRINYLDFDNSPIASLPYLFSCITFGNTLTLSITVTIESEEIISQVFDSLK